MSRGVHKDRRRNGGWSAWNKSLRVGVKEASCKVTCTMHFHACVEHASVLGQTAEEGCTEMEVSETFSSHMVFHGGELILSLAVNQVYNVNYVIVKLQGQQKSTHSTQLQESPGMPYTQSSSRQPPFRCHGLGHSDATHLWLEK